MHYAVDIPMLVAECDVSACVQDNVIHVRHVLTRICDDAVPCATSVMVHLPPGCDPLPDGPIHSNSSSSIKLVRTDVSTTLVTSHPLRDRWWGTTMALCAAAEDGDGAAWDAAWAALERVALEYLKFAVSDADADTVVSILTGASPPLPLNVATAIWERAMLSSPGWTQGAADMVLSTAHAALDAPDPPPGALGRLEQLLTRGGIPAANLVGLCSNGMARMREEALREHPDWICVESAPGLAVHEAVQRCSGVPVQKLLGHVLAYGHKTVRVPHAADERAAIKALCRQSNDDTRSNCAKRVIGCDP